MAELYLWEDYNAGYDPHNVFAISILATNVWGLRDPLVGRDPQFEKPCCNAYLCCKLLNFIVDFVLLV